MKDTTHLLMQRLGAVLLGGVGGAILGALIGLIFSDLLGWWRSGGVIIGSAGLGALAGIVANVQGGATDSLEDDW